VTGDPDWLREAVTVVVANGIQHNRPGGELALRTGTANGRAWLEAADTGPGIPAAAQPRVFDRFFRVDAARSRRSGGGSGLGLAIAKRAVEAHGGRIALESGEGEGTTVRIDLPARSASA
jgi:two-component system OmpR family sensor kinase